MNHEQRRAIAIWRMSVLGPLVSARLDHGDLRPLLEAAATRTYETPQGRRVRPGWRTLEAWYYAYKKGGLPALEPTTRNDMGTSRALPEALAQHIVALRREQPRRSVRTLIRAVERAGMCRVGETSASSVLRLLRAHGLSQRPCATAARERRPFLPEHPGDLWMGDSMHGPRVRDADGVLRKTYLLTQLDVASRFVIHSQFFLSEDAAHQEDGLRHAITGHGLPRTYYVDRGPAYIAESLRRICADLGIWLVHTAPGDCEAKGAIERYHKTWRAEVGCELPDALPLAELDERHIAWVTREYNRRVHGTTDRVPLEHFLAGCDHLRPVPRGIDFDGIFLHRVTRKVRSDCTVRWDGGFVQVPGEYAGQTIELRFAPLQPELPPAIFVDDVRVGVAEPLDLVANSSGRRRQLPQPEPPPRRTLKGPLDYITDEYHALLKAFGEDLDDPEEQP
jgi:transposase InsO family protein